MERTRRRRHVEPITIGLVVSIIVSLLVLLAPGPPAEAQPSSPEFAVDRLVATSADCVASESFQGFAFGVGWCRPGGYYEGVSAADCNQAPVASFFLQDVCYWAVQLQPASALCAPPLITLTGTFASGQPYVACVLPVLQLGATSSSAATTICIESEVVQQSDAAASLRVGDTFGGGEDRFLITAGGATCSFGCLDGFDVNCDGKLGDYCAAELDRSSVAGVKECLASPAD